MIELAPSLLAADLLHLGKEVEMMMDCGVSTLHFDVMDAHFVPNLSFGPSLCKTVKAAHPACTMDVHLMMDNPLDYVQVFADAGAHTLTLHLEVLEDVPGAMGAIRRAGMRCGLSVKPKTPAENLLPYLNTVDHILIMTVEPGFGGQKFMPEQVEKIRLLRSAGFTGVISVDGGVNAENAALLVRAGANHLVMGTAFFRADNPRRIADAIKELT